ncbi:MAG: glycerol-3-phosphate 1-O-acyltransferase PlsY [Sphingomicrobium sp.]
MLFALGLGYFLGSIPFGLLIAKAGGKGDVRDIGSGSIGATNVLRTGSKGLAALTLLLDAAKGTLAVWLAQRYFPGFEAHAAAGALVGHLYPVWLRFKGGKGVATLLGILVLLLPTAALVYALVWIGLLLLVRISSVSGLAAAASAPVTAVVVGEQGRFPLLLGFAILVVWKHHQNIRRLLLGTEPRVGRAKA